ncbi:phosphoribosylformimino-5-aminoimidazole carboxamide ribotide isomerase [Methanococcoides methylutens]|uniref:Phosphoribosylformimino-5-aminoimidazole carboxamide ribotide isomerase n=1 Tax=Methanococcoides methylutens TaxID=2226 RepID=A0A099SZX3_METMT|nr:HisA/HisF-related TIM barrel protein [Methanococcoides methylutens]KGK98442.1 phosphoribosylformimino-5-aminoimidazole carboxamide ribotide isomerase [Methanococcoides methylutens]
MFRIVFVFDVYNHNAVHAQGGDRRRYRPVHESSTLCTTSDPVEIVRSLRPEEVYIADLNRLQGQGAPDINFDVIRAVSDQTNVMLDAGVSSFEDIMSVIDLADHPVLGTETASLDTISKVASQYPSRVNVSIDKKDGVILSSDPSMPKDPLEIVEMLNGLDINDVIFLDMDMVGTSAGFDAQFLSLIADVCEHDVLLGGGVRGLEDIGQLEDIGIKGALVATALHNGSIPVTMLQ